MTVSIIESLKSILAEQVAAYGDFIVMLQQERACLMTIDPTGVESLYKEKDSLILKLSLLEEERVRMVGTLSRDEQLTGPVTLLVIAERTGDHAFFEYRTKLISLLQSITELNAFNRTLIDRSVSVVKNALSFLGAIGITTPLQQKGARFSREV